MAKKAAVKATPKRLSTKKKNSLTSSKKGVQGKKTSVTEPIPRAKPIELLDSPIFNIKWNEYIPTEPSEKQLAVLMLAHIKEILYGGALGGGKSELLLQDSVRYCDIPGFSSIIFRRQLTDLKQPGALIDRSHKWLGPWAAKGRCKYIADEHAWVFNTTYPGTDIAGAKARLQFGYIGEAAVRDRYQSAEYSWVGFDELSQWPDDVDYLFMRSRIRTVVCSIHKHKPNSDEPNWHPNCVMCNCLKNMPLRVRAATNPGAAWIKRRFRIVPDPVKYPNKRAAIIAMQEGIKVKFVGTHPTRIFIPAALEDNPHLSIRDYREMLSEMSDEERSRLEDGNWDVRKEARFKRRWQKFYALGKDSFCLTDDYGRLLEEIPLSRLEKIFVTVDPAVTVREGMVDDQISVKRSYCAFGVFGVYKGYLLVLEMLKFREEIPDVVDKIVELDQKWNPQFTKIEVNGVGIGVAQYANLAGIRVQKNIRKTDKIENSISAMILMKHGKVLFPEQASWLDEHDVEDVIFGWTGLPTEEDDLVDVLCDAAHEVARPTAMEVSNPSSKRSAPRSVGNIFGKYGSISTLSPTLRSSNGGYFRHF